MAKASSPFVKRPNEMPVAFEPSSHIPEIPAERPAGTQSPATAVDACSPSARRADRGWKGFLNDFLDGRSGEDSRQDFAAESEGPPGANEVGAVAPTTNPGKRESCTS